MIEKLRQCFDEMVVYKARIHILNATVGSEALFRRSRSSRPLYAAGSWRLSRWNPLGILRGP